MASDFSTMMTFRLHAFILLLAAALTGTPASALDPGTPIGSYRHDVFASGGGAPRSTNAMAMTADGWLWFGGASGLYRFDGARFEAFQPRAGERLLGKFITTLVPRANGELWIGYLYGGLSVLRDGRLVHIAAGSGNKVGQVASVAFDGADAWAASSTGLWRYRDGAWTRAGAEAGFVDGRARYAYRDQYGRLWASSETRLYLLDRAGARFEPVSDVSPDSVVLESPDGRVWAADSVTVRLLPEPEGGWRKRAPPAVRFTQYQSMFDKDGNYWTGNCPTSVCVRRPAGITASFPDLSGSERLPRPAGAGNTTVIGLLEDREGNIWISTTAGVERLRDSRLVPLPMPRDSDWPTLALDGAGGAWIASSLTNLQGNLWRVRDGKPVHQDTGQGTNFVANGRDRTVLVAGKRWIERRLGDRVVERIALPQPKPGDAAPREVLLLAEGSDGMWAYLSGHGLYHYRNGAWEPPAAHPWLGAAIYAFVDDAGRIWFGTRHNGVVLVDGPTRRGWGPEDGIALGAVTFVDASRELLIAGDGGMAVWQNGRFRPLRAAGVDLANVSGVAATPDGDRWLNTARGLLHVRAADWQRSMRDPARPLHGALWDDLHGFPGGGYAVSPVSTLRLGADGTMWVVGVGGIARFDPARIRTNPVAPVAEVRSIVANGISHDGGVVGELAAGTGRLHVEFTAPSTTMPERVRFRYRLAGADANWQDAGTLRTAWYTNLGPGDYRFEVRAYNEDGVAGPVASTPAFRIRPRFVETGWFVLLCACIAGAGLYALYLLRLAQVKRGWQARMSERTAERERIARTLHDTFLQSLQAVMFRLDALAARLAPGSGERTQIESLLDSTRKVVAEGRSQMFELRNKAAPPELAAALCAWADMLRTGQNVDVTVRQSGTPQALAPEVRVEVEAIACEAIANALRHAGARHIEVTLDWTAMPLIVRVGDDGVGMPPELMASGRPGHWGVPGMRERASRIGALLSLRNRAGGGLEVAIDLAGPGDRPVASQASRSMSM